MNTIKSCQFNMDTACVDVVYASRCILHIYTPMIEESLRTTIYSRAKLDLLIENEPIEYARMVLDGTLQDFLDKTDGIVQEQLQSYTERLEVHLSKNVAGDIAREMMMYS